MAPRKVHTRKSRRNLKEIGLNQMTVDLQLKIRRRGSAAGQMKKSASCASYGGRRCTCTILRHQGTRIGAGP